MRAARDEPVGGRCAGQTVGQGRYEPGRLRARDRGDAHGHLRPAARRRRSNTWSTRAGSPHYAAEKDGADRVENLQELVSAAESFTREPSCRSPAKLEVETGDALTAFLAHAALGSGRDAGRGGRPALQLMTVHAAKGLEFHTVFLTGLEEGLFPHENSLSELRRSRGGTAACLRCDNARGGACI